MKLVKLAILCGFCSLTGVMIKSHAAEIDAKRSAVFPADVLQKRCTEKVEKACLYDFNDGHKKLLVKGMVAYFSGRVLSEQIITAWDPSAYIPRRCYVAPGGMVHEGIRLGYISTIRDVVREVAKN